MKTLLITGTTGFIGKNLLKLIEKNYSKKYKVVLLSSNVTNSKYTTVDHKNYTFSKDDFIQNSIFNIDIVLHIGAFTPKSSKEANNIQKSNDNIINTKYLIDNLPNIPEKFIFTSTLDVYGNTNNQIIDENCTTIPLTMYGWSKLYCENMIESWAKEQEIVFQVLRVGHIYGKGEESYKKVIPETIKKLKSGINPQIFGKGEEKRSFMHVDDVCRLILKSIESERYLGPINLCSSNSYKIKDVIQMLLEISGNKKLSIDYITNDNPSIDFVFNTEKMHRLLGSEEVELKDGLTEEYKGESIT